MAISKLNVKRAVAVVLAVLASAVLCSSPAAAAPKSPRQVLVIGMDGLDPDFLKQMFNKGKLPNFQRLVDGAFMTRYESENPTRSPAIWTTVATGHHRSTHGIWDFVTGSNLWPRELRGKTFRLMTSNDRKVRALWNYTTVAKVPSAVVNWMVTWPAEKVHGQMVAPYASLQMRILQTYKGQIRHGAPDQIYPPEQSEELSSLVVKPGKVSLEQVQRIALFPPRHARVYDEIEVLRQYRYGVRWTLANTETTTRIAEHLMQKHKPRLVMAYYDGADTLSHRFWLFRRSRAMIAERLELIGVDPNFAKPLQRRFRNVVNGYYEIADEALGRLMAAAEPDATIILLSDHGFGNLGYQPKKDMETPFTGSHQKDGVFIVAGPGSDSITSGRKVSIYDVTPTVLTLLGIPVPADLKGNALLKTDAPQVAQHLRGKISSQRKNLGEHSDDKPEFEDEELERLRSLGYLQ